MRRCWFTCPIRACSSVRSGGDLQNALTKRPDSLTTPKRLRICKEVAAGMAYLVRASVSTRARGCSCGPMGGSLRASRVADHLVLCLFCSRLRADVASPLAARAQVPSSRPQGAQRPGVCRADRVRFSARHALARLHRVTPAGCPALFFIVLSGS